ncbi:hypothetical protein RHDE110596_19675 [Prescottella defluvii]|nr:hypothetical protein [Prescottella defluvii]
MGSITDLIAIPVGSADAVITGYIKSVDQTIQGLTTWFAGVTGNLGGSL